MVIIMGKSSNICQALVVTLFIFTTIFAKAHQATVYFKEDFTEADLESRSVYSKHSGKEYGKFELTPGKFYGDEKRDQIIKTSEDDKFSCEYYNSTHCSTEKCSSVVDCAPGSQACFAVWRNDTSTNLTFSLTIMNKGCWSEPKDCNNSCIDSRPNRNVRFCCCRGSMCNSAFYYQPYFQEEQNGTSDTVPNDTFIYGGVLIITAVIFAAVISYSCFRCKIKSNSHLYEMPNHDDAASQPFQPSDNGDTKNNIIDLNKVELISELATGRFGVVHKGYTELLTTGEFVNVAVKICPPQEYQSLQNEQQVYCLPQMNHENILKFYCAEKKIDSDGLNFSYWLVTEFMELGSLYDYLKNNSITWEKLLHITRGIALGMLHLHEDIIPARGSARKPSVAHRDFKSKNVLLKTDLTPCIADFGLAYIFHPDQPVSTRHGQIGTRRYMAPEILEGSIGFTTDAFIKIDMYAVGLVLWELISRCAINSSVKPSEPYMLPFELEAGSMPTTETMYKVVVVERKRPIMRDEWYQNQDTKLFCDTILECWDNDPDARSSAANVYERVKSLSSNYNKKCER